MTLNMFAWWVLNPQITVESQQKSLRAKIMAVINVLITVDFEQVFVAHLMYI